MENISKLLGDSAAIKANRKLIKQFRQSETNVLIQGPAGTEKEQIAYLLHQQSSRKSGPFISLVCAQLSDEEIISKLTCTTGAVSNSSEGTLFIADIDKLPKKAQEFLLHIIDAKEFHPDEKQAALAIELRLIGASEQDLATLVQKRLFHEDFYYRLRGYILDLPALAKRKEDISCIVKYELAQLNKTHQANKCFSTEAMNAICQHDWPGNIFELNLNIAHAFEASDDEQIKMGDLPAQLSGIDEEGSISLDDIDDMKELERLMIERTLKTHKNDPRRAAKRLKMGLSTLYRKMQTYKIER